MAKKKSKKKVEDNSKVAIMLGFVVLGIGVLFYAYLNSRGGNPTSGSDDGASFTSFIPIYTAIFVPMLVAKNNEDKGEKLTKVQKWVLISIVLGTIALVAFTFLYWFR